MKRYVFLIGVAILCLDMRGVLAKPKVFSSGSSSSVVLESTTLAGESADSYFGLSVSGAGDVNGDGYADVIVGAPYYDSIGDDDGRAYLYYGASEGLDSTPTIIVSAEDEDYQLGYAVTGIGDVNGDGYDDVAISIPLYDDGVSEYAGRVDIYYGARWGLLSPLADETLTLTGENAFDYFGFSVSAAGDINGDGYDDLMVGATGYDDGSNDEAGRVYIYYGSASGLDETSLATITGENKDDYFGHAVSSAGDLNGDGYDEVVVGVPLYSDGVNQEVGRIYLYYGSASGLDVTSPETLTGRTPYDALGESASSAGDVNGDGYDDLVVGTTGSEAGLYLNAGRVDIYYGSSSGLDTHTYDTLYGDCDYQYLGGAVSAAGDVDGDGYDDVIIGAHGYYDGLAYAGSAYLYYGSSSGIDSLSPITFSGENKNDELGYSVSSTGDIDGDGAADIIIGVPGYDSNIGMAYVYYPANQTKMSVDAGFVYKQNFLSLGLLTTDGYLGYSIATGDLNGDGYDDLVVGAPFYYDASGGHNDEGGVFIFYGSTAGIDEDTYEVFVGGDKDLLMGFAVACADTDGDGYDDLIVSLPGYLASVRNSGQVRIYKGRSSGVSKTSYTKINGPINGYSSSSYVGFGESVANAGDINGDWYEDIIVGAPDYDYSSSKGDAGAVYVYLGNSKGIVSFAAADWSKELTSSGYEAGKTVAGIGDVNKDGYDDIAFGLPGASGGGYVHVYYGSSGGLGSSADFATGGGSGATLGTSLAKAGDINKDGYDDLIVGDAGYDTTICDDKGRARIYYGSASGLSSSSENEMAFIPQNGAYLGQSVLGIGDFNEDGYDDFVVGAVGYDGDFTDEGQILITQGVSSSHFYTTPHMFYANTDVFNGGEQGLGLGWALATGDTDGDGNLEVFVGTPNYSFAEGADDHAGGVYKFEINPAE